MGGISYQYNAASPEVSHQHLYPSVSRFLTNAPPGSIVMDAGCGNGSFISLFQDRSWQLHGSDLSPTGIELARKTHPNINFFLADGQSLYADFLSTVGPVDIVLSTEVIEHVYDPRGFLRNCFALLKPGGTIVLTTPYHGYLKNLLLAATGKMDQHFTVLWDHGHIKFWSRKTIEGVLKETGFTNIEFSGSGRIPYVWKSMVLKATKPA
ncbi:MAG TPA: class I SAM-dependent methyltransferase [Edaphobacter sp.]|jgi:2-polyprenyl-3-methyl-5-hydroxy-6-metoxy-1,4-benzoquinol methylase|nr:class I SAM-dependent methyltransferase [Edaphobacter sp.]